jgi:hypothetical protein
MNLTELTLSDLTKLELDRYIAEAYYYLSIAMEGKIKLDISFVREPMAIALDMNSWGETNKDLTVCKVCLAGLIFTLKTKKLLGGYPILSFNALYWTESDIDKESLNLLTFLDGLRGVLLDPAINKVLSQLGYEVLDELNYEGDREDPQSVLERLKLFVELNPPIMEQFWLLD